jgi:4-hydroxybenzoate polyprenyltransferase
MAAAVRRFVALSRWREWLDSKLPLILLAVVVLVPDTAGVMQIVGAILATALWLAFGYGVNEISDRRCDEAAGKANHADGLPAAALVGFTLLTGGGAIGLSVLTYPFYAGVAWTSAGLIIAATYSLPPVRWKERGLIGLIAGAAAQRTLPVLAIATGFLGGHIDRLTWLLAAHALAVGLRWMVVHQWQDRQADQKASVRTFIADGHSPQTMIMTIFGCEIALVAAFIVASERYGAVTCLVLAAYVIQQRFLCCSDEGLQSRLLGYRRAPLAEIYGVLWPLAVAVQRAANTAGWWLMPLLIIVIGRPYLATLRGDLLDFRDARARSRQQDQVDDNPEVKS